MMPVFSALLLASVLGGCSGTPAAPAVVQPARQTPEDIARTRAKDELKHHPNTAAALVYAKPDGVYVDARYLGQQTYTVARGEIEAQLGALVSQTDLPPGQGQEIKLERGTLRVYNDRIYLVDVPLPEPVRRDQALGMCGFPVSAALNWAEFSGEYRVLNQWGFRRVIFTRKARDSEDIVRVQAWRALVS